MALRPASTPVMSLKALLKQPPRSSEFGTAKPLQTLGSVMILIFRKAPEFGLISSNELTIVVVDRDRQLHLIAQLHDVLH